MLTHYLNMTTFNRDLCNTATFLKQLQAKLSDFSTAVAQKRAIISKLNLKIQKLAQGCMELDGDNLLDRIIIFIENSITYVQRRKINSLVMASYSAIEEMVKSYTAFFDKANEKLEKINCSKITFGRLTVKSSLEIPDCSVDNQQWSREVTKLTDHLDIYLEMLEERIKVQLQYLNSMTNS